MEEDPTRTRKREVASINEKLEKVKREIAAIESEIENYETKIAERESQKQGAKEFGNYKKHVEELRKLRFERKRLRIDLGEARKREIDEAQKEIKRIEADAIIIAEKIVGTLFHAYELTLELDRARSKAIGIVSDYEDSDLHFNAPIIGRLGHSLRVFLERQFPVDFLKPYPPETPLRNKIISKMEETLAIPDRQF